MNLDYVLEEAKRNKNFLLTVSILDLIERELKDKNDEEDKLDKIFVLSVLVELKSELLLYLFNLVPQKKKNFESEEDVVEIVNLLEKTVEKKVVRSSFIEKVSTNEIPISKLTKIVKEVLEREKFYENKVIVNNSISLAEIMENLKERLKKEFEIDFKILIEECNSKLEIIVTFLAVLILAKNKYLLIIQEDNFSPILLRYNEEGRIPLRN